MRVRGLQQPAYATGTANEHAPSDTRLAITRSRTSLGEWASSTLPTPVACMGSRLPTVLTIGMAELTSWITIELR